jgi:hypothetical protein
MCEALEAACKELGDNITQPEVAPGVLARRVIAAAKLGERDPIRLHRPPRSANRTDDPFVQAVGRTRRWLAFFNSKGPLAHG